MIPNERDTYRGEETPECVVCGEEIAADKWHAATTERSDDGRLTIRSFCSRACRDRWEAT